MSQVQYETFEPEYAGDDRVTRIGGADDKPLSRQLGSIRMEHSPQGTTYFRLDASNNVPQVRALLEHAGYPIDNSDIRNGSILLRRAPIDPATIVPGRAIPETRLLTNDDLHSLLKTLSTDVDLGRGDSIYSVLDKATANEIADRDMTARGIRPSQAGIVKIDTVPHDVERYGDYGVRGTVDAQIADGPVSRLSEELAPAGVGDRVVGEVSTQIDIRDPHDANAVSASLEKAGIKAKVNRGPDVVKVVEGRADNAALETVLKERGIEFRHSPNSSTWKFNSAEDADVAGALMRKAQPGVKFDVPTPEVHITAVSATADEVAKALAKSGHVQGNIADEIADTALDLHPEQSANNKAVREAGPKLAAESTPDVSAPEVKKPNPALEEMRHRLAAQGPGRMAPGMGNARAGRFGRAAEMTAPGFERDLHAPLRPLPPKVDKGAAQAGDPETLKQLDQWMEEARVEAKMDAEIQASREEYAADKSYRTNVKLPEKAQKLKNQMEDVRAGRFQPIDPSQTPQPELRPTTQLRPAPNAPDVSVRVPTPANDGAIGVLNKVDDVPIDVTTGRVVSAIDNIDFNMPKRPHVKGGLIGAAIDVGITATVGTVVGVATRSNDQDVISAGANGAGEAVKQMVGYNDFKAGDNLRGAAAVIDTATGGAFVQVVDADRENQRRLAVPQDKISELIANIRPDAKANTGNTQLDNLGTLLDMKRRGLTEVHVPTDGGRLQEPMGTIMVEGYLIGHDVPIDQKIHEEAGIFLGNGGTLQQAQMALNPEFRQNAKASAILDIAPTADTKGAYEPRDPHLRRIEALKTDSYKFKDDPERVTAINGEMMNEARAYIDSGKSVKDARFDYYRTAIVIEESVGNDLAAMGKGRQFDLNKDGKIAINEIVQVMQKAGVTSMPDFDKDEMTGARDVINAIARAESKGR